jgi:hypothetical protein
MGWATSRSLVDTKQAECSDWQSREYHDHDGRL